ncbi:ankyrin repeat domain-containing protein 37 [Pseudophryne corroboree]|uniref:ankyrin repeat domain-containing protein 37 n=1 Tax=Pseudophryne corroboree TaxID=495146 RepID=UPI003081F9BA
MCSVFEYVTGGGACVPGCCCWGTGGGSESLRVVYVCEAVSSVVVLCLYRAETMELQRSSGECYNPSQLMQSGCAVNSPGDTLGQTPAHLAACGGQAFFLLWQLQTGVDINQQDLFGEALIHKAARSGSLQCLSLLVAHAARLDVCNREGYTAEDLALSGGFPECAKYLATVKHTQDTFSRARFSMHDLKETTSSVKRGQCNNVSAAHGKRRRSDGFM